VLFAQHIGKFLAWGWLRKPRYGCPLSTIRLDVAIDTLIGRHGPKALVSDVIAAYLADYDRQQADRTDHHAAQVTEATSGDPNAATHGGDGNSGDMDSPAETSAEGREAADATEAGETPGNAANASAGNGKGTACADDRAADSPAMCAGDEESSNSKIGGGEPKDSIKPESPSSGQTAGSDNEVESDDTAGASDNATVGAPEDDEMAADAASGQFGDGQDGADKATDGLTNQTSVDEACDADHAQAMGRLDPTKGAQDPTDDGQSPSADGDAGAPIGNPLEGLDASPSRVGGGVSGQKQQPRLVDYKTASQIAAISRGLQRLVGTLSSTTPIPLWEGHKVLSEIVSHQYRIHRMRQVQRTPVCVLVMGDVSGSCAWLSHLIMPVTYGLSKQCPMVLGTYTGDLGQEGTFWPDCVFGRQKHKFRYLPPMDNPSVALWKQYKAAGITHLLVIGDAHGHYSYKCASDAGIEVLWCNPNEWIQPEQDIIAHYNINYVLMGNENDIAGAINKLISHRR
jgi:hypothetical protein